MHLETAEIAGPLTQIPVRGERCRRTESRLYVDQDYAAFRGNNVRSSAIRTC